MVAKIETKIQWRNLYGVLLHFFNTVNVDAEIFFFFCKAFLLAYGIKVYFCEIFCSRLAPQSSLQRITLLGKTKERL